MKDRLGDRLFQVTVNSLLVIIGILVFYPLIFVVSASISEPALVASGQMILIPRGITFEGYKYIFESKWIVRGYINSAYYTLGGTILNLIVTFFAGYALSRRDLLGRGIISTYMIIPMWFSGGIIPTFLVVKNLGLVDTPFVLMIMGLISMYNTLICRSYISNSIPYELQESARIDGCNDFMIALKIIRPLSTPVLAILTLYYAIGHWNGYLDALIYLNRRELQPLQIFLREVLIQNTSMEMEFGDIAEIEDMVHRQQMSQIMKFGLIVVGSLPMIIMYPFVQKYFIQGMMIGAVKG